MNKSLTGTKWESISGYAIIVVWGVVYMGARLSMELTTLPDWLRVVIAVLPLAPLIGVIWGVMSYVRSLDELVRKIHLEALAVAFPLTVAMLMVLGLLELAVGLSPDDWSYRHVWPMPILFYTIGLFFAYRRYK